MWTSDLPIPVCFFPVCEGEQSEMGDAAHQISKSLRDVQKARCLLLDCWGIVVKLTAQQRQIAAGNRTDDHSWRCWKWSNLVLSLFYHVASKSIDSRVHSFYALGPHNGAQIGVSKIKSWGFCLLEVPHYEIHDVLVCIQYIISYK